MFSLQGSKWMVRFDLMLLKKKVVLDRISINRIDRVVVKIVNLYGCKEYILEQDREGTFLYIVVSHFLSG